MNPRFSPRLPHINHFDQITKAGSQAPSSPFLSVEVLWLMGDFTVFFEEHCWLFFDTISWPCVQGDWHWIADYIGRKNWPCTGWLGACHKRSPFNPLGFSADALWALLCWNNLHGQLTVSQFPVPCCAAAFPAPFRRYHGEFIQTLYFSFDFQQRQYFFLRWATLWISCETLP